MEADSITRYDPDYSDEVQDMVPRNYGDWVEYDSHRDIVKELEDRIDALQSCVNKAFKELAEESR